MSKKSIKSGRPTAFTASDFLDVGKKRLDIKQIRAFVTELELLPDGAPLPDWSHLTVNDRFAIARRFVPREHLEELLGKSDSQIQRYEQGFDIPLSVVAALAAETQIPLEWIVTGRLTDDEPRDIGPQAGQIAEQEDVALQKLAFKVSAGGGSLVVDDDASYVRFPTAVLDLVGLNQQYAKLAEGSGESMRPTINDGDLLLIDVSLAAKQIVEGKVYIFSIGEEAYVKRLRKVGDRTLMVSDNREVFPEELVPDYLPMRIYGRVVWAGRKL